MTNNEIRNYFGHGEGSCQVRIRRDGSVERRGYRDPFDRSPATWLYMGTREEMAQDIQNHEEAK